MPWTLSAGIRRPWRYRMAAPRAPTWKMPGLASPPAVNAKSYAVNSGKIPEVDIRPIRARCPKRAPGAPVMPSVAAITMRPS